MNPNCQKAIAFRLFDEGKRPAEIYHLVSVKKHTLFYYFQLWKKEKENAKQVTRRNDLERQLRNRIKRCQTRIEQMQYYPQHYKQEDIPKWQSAKRRAEQLLQDPSDISREEIDLLSKYYST